MGTRFNQLAHIQNALNDAENLATAACKSVAVAQKALVEVAADLSGDPATDLQTLPAPSDHRRRHRYGPAPKIDRDPELAAFIQARLDRMTFVEIADAVKNKFSPERAVGKSAIWDWYQRQL